MTSTVLSSFSRFRAAHEPSALEASSKLRMMDGPPETQKVLRESPVQVTDSPKLDLESYIANYDGPTRLDRLTCIATSSRLPISREALRLALAEAKQGRDVDRYLAIAQYASDRDSDATTDVEWVTKTRELVTRDTNKLEHELKGYKNNLIKESIRMGNEDLGHHYYTIGDYSNAYKAYSRMREFCTTPKHLVDMSLRLVLVAAAQDNWMIVQSSIYKIQSLAIKPDDSTKSSPITSPIAGLAFLCSGDYATAADRFLKSDPAFLLGADARPGPTSGIGAGQGIVFQRQLLTPNDVAVYGALCALATLNRAELQARVLDNADFRTFLELEPHLRRVVAYFISGKYTQALDILESHRSDYLFDVFLQRHVSELYATIRRKAMTAYVAPFSRISFDAIAAAFPPRSTNTTALSAPSDSSADTLPAASRDSLEEELVALITGGHLPEFRIDAVNRELVCLAKDERRLAYDKALRVAGETERALRLRLFRINMIAAGMEVKGNKGSGSDGKLVGGGTSGAAGKVKGRGTAIGA